MRMLQKNIQIMCKISIQLLKSKNVEGYNLKIKHKLLIVFDDMIADMISKKKVIK